MENKLGSDRYRRLGVRDGNRRLETFGDIIGRITIWRQNSTGKHKLNDETTLSGLSFVVYLLSYRTLDNLFRLFGFCFIQKKMRKMS